MFWVHLEIKGHYKSVQFLSYWNISPLIAVVCFRMAPLLSTRWEWGLTEWWHDEENGVKIYTFTRTQPSWTGDFELMCSTVVSNAVIKTAYWKNSVPRFSTVSGNISDFCLRSSVVAVLISLISDMSSMLGLYGGDLVA